MFFFRPNQRKGEGAQPELGAPHRAPHRAPLPQWYYDTVIMNTADCVHSANRSTAHRQTHTGTHTGPGNEHGEGAACVAVHPFGFASAMPLEGTADGARGGAARVPVPAPFHSTDRPINPAPNAATSMPCPALPTTWHHDFKDMVDYIFYTCARPDHEQEGRRPVNHTLSINIR